MKLSVLMITYNHEQYLAQALDSVLMQEVDFDYEIVLGEDCSTDNTRAICTDYRNRFPDKIRLLLHDKNVGATPNLVQTLQSCTGEYIAVLEGDDYWVSPRKLQDQVDFLDSHSECVECFGYALLYYMDRCEVRGMFPPRKPPEISTQLDLLSRNYIPTCTVMFRRDAVEEFPDWFHKIKMADWSLHILNAQHGKIGFLDETLAAYRIHPGGAWTGAGQSESNYEAIDQIYDCVSNRLGIRFGRREKAARLHYKAKLFSMKGDNRRALSAALRSFVLCPRNPILLDAPHALVLRMLKRWLGGWFSGRARAVSGGGPGG